MRQPRQLGLVLTLWAGACGGRSIAGGDGALDLSPRKDAAVPVAKDAGPRADSEACHCDPGEVWLFGSCVPTTQLGCGPTCDPQQPASCPDGKRCDPGAALPFCIASSTRPACVPDSPSMAPGTLRVTPTSGPVGKSVTLYIEGAEFWIGALEWMARLGHGKPQIFSLAPEVVCRRAVTLVPPGPGIYPVEVGYGMPPQGSEWRLAGFFVATAGVTPPPLVQPGYPCAPTDQCAEAAPYTCACAAGRCACSK